MNGHSSGGGSNHGTTWVSLPPILMRDLKWSVADVIVRLVMSAAETSLACRAISHLAGNLFESVPNPVAVVGIILTKVIQANIVQVPTSSVRGRYGEWTPFPI